MILPPQVQAEWFLLGAALILFGVGAYAGHKWEAGETQEALRERDAAITQRDKWKQTANTRGTALDAWEKRYKADEAQAQEYAKRAGEVLEELERMKRDHQAQEAEWRKRYAIAIKSPDCAALAQATKCEAFSRY